MAKSTKIKDRALNTAMRNRLLAYAKDTIKCPKEEEALDAAYNRAKPYVIEAVRKTFPVKDMKVLEKYGLAYPDQCIRFGGRYNHDEVFNFRTEKEAPHRPRYTSCSEHQYEWSAEARKALITYVLARQAHAKAMQQKEKDYKRLIVGSRTFGDVVSVWSAAEKLRSTLIPATSEQRALAVLSEDAIARIKADNAGAK